MNEKETAGSAEQARPLYATRSVGNEIWQAEVLLTDKGVAIGYTGRFRPKKEGPHRRVHSRLCHGVCER
jgi:hypothetical protein